MSFSLNTAPNGLSAATQPYNGRDKLFNKCLILKLPCEKNIIEQYMYYYNKCLRPCRWILFFFHILLTAVIWLSERLSDQKGNLNDERVAMFRNTDASIIGLHSNCWQLNCNGKLVGWYDTLFGLQFLCLFIHLCIYLLINQICVNTWILLTFQGYWKPIFQRNIRFLLKVCVSFLREERVRKLVRIDKAERSFQVFSINMHQFDNFVYTIWHIIGSLFSHRLTANRTVLAWGVVYILERHFLRLQNY